MKWIIVVLTILFLLLQYKLWVGEGSWLVVKQLREKIEAQIQQNEQLKARNVALEAEVKNLKNGLDAIEERARNELGMIKDDETFFQLGEETGNAP